MKITTHYGQLIKLILLALVLTTSISCDKEVDVIELSLFVSNDTFEVSNGNSQQKTDVLTNKPWSATSNVDWITFEKSSGDKGRFDLIFSVIENEDDKRNGTITVMIGDDTVKEIMVVQEAGNRDDIYVVLNGTGEGYSWDEATNLDNALQIAVSGNTIHIAEGIYISDVTVSGGDPSSDGDKTFEVSKNITLKGGYAANATKGAIADASLYSTILSGNGTSYHVVTVTAGKTEGQKVAFNGLTITKGNAFSKTSNIDIKGVDFRRDYGGGMTIGNSVVDIIDTNIIENQSERFVAGLYIFDQSVVTIKNSKINNNISTSNAAGIWVNTSKLYIYDSQVIANESPGTAPGVHGYPNAEIYMYNSVIANNKGRSFGAAFYIRDGSKGVLVNSLISGNSSTSTNGGGGVMMYDNNDVTIISSTITDNTIAGPGGGIYRRSNVNTVTILNSIISGNTQKDDGPDVDVYESDAIDTVIKASVTGSTTYNENGVIETDAVFNYNSMLQSPSSFVVIPIGTDNPAIDLGMASQKLIEIGLSQDPIIPQAIIAYDLLKKSRDGLKIMGAFVSK
ncbi:right-handed parallel beta-helix repeat-containing protein [Gelidibacter salicanalis]|uniref:Right-handed parallel beta-helix repeat-containing protein n=1 Tax=Gelidibacter salicanalis TaxID=291193 RepID=A0A934KXP8_9FLAO|nr:right-handed parallel beta-helix repeat-containing protein [Gelidibacter salicanalis]MBJ7882477.1 right-handed parallel beta-helix repeat-containing protein [Gelidibacter salicanalis]